MGYETVAIAKTANKATASGDSGYTKIYVIAELAGVKVFWQNLATSGDSGYLEITKCLV